MTDRLEEIRRRWEERHDGPTRMDNHRRVMSLVGGIPYLLSLIDDLQSRRCETCRGWKRKQSTMWGWCKLAEESAWDGRFRTSGASGSLFRSDFACNLWEG